MNVPDLVERLKKQVEWNGWEEPYISDIITAALSLPVSNSRAEAIGAAIAELREEDDSDWPVNSERKAGWHAALDAVDEALRALLNNPQPDSRAEAIGVKPLEWEPHPCGLIAAPPTGYAYIIETRMKGRAYFVKGLNHAPIFDDAEAAKAAAQADYEQRIRSALLKEGE